jgi:hypothetical protein
MAKRKESTIEDLKRSIKASFKHWNTLRRRGGVDPLWPDGTNMNLVRRHIIHDQGRLKDLCKVEKVRPCPVEARLKPPRQVSCYYCAPRSKAGPCRERRRKGGL